MHTRKPIRVPSGCKLALSPSQSPKAACAHEAAEGFAHEVGAQVVPGVASARPTFSEMREDCLPYSIEKLHKAERGLQWLHANKNSKNKSLTCGKLKGRFLKTLNL